MLRTLILMYEEVIEDADSSIESAMSSSISSVSDSGRFQPTNVLHYGYMIVFMELFERITYYSVLANLLLFCQVNLKLNTVDSTCIILAFVAFSYLMPFFGVWLADEKTGKYNLIYGACLFYLVGVGLLLFVSSTLCVTKVSKFVSFGLALAFISIGTGGIKSNISAFGLDQVSPYGVNAMHRFFTWFYWMINLSSVIAFTVVAYLQTQNFFYGFIPPTATMFLSLVCFLLGRSKYTCKPASGSPITDTVKVFFHAMHRRCQHKKQLLEDLPRGSSLSLFDYAHILYGGKYSNSQIDLVQCVGRVALVMSTTIMFWAVYFQMATTFLLQGQSMNLSLSSEFKLPAASMNLFDCLTVLVFLLIVERILYRISRRFRWNLSTLKLMGFGMLLAALAMYLAGIVEVHRKKHLNGSPVNIISGKSYNASTLTVFYQVPQFALIGASEVFTSISCLEFAYSQSPKYLHSVILGLFLAMSGFGALLSCCLVLILSSYTNWLCMDINFCKMEYYFYLMAGLMLVNFLFFAIVASKYEYVNNYLAGTRKSRWSQSSSGSRRRDPVKSPAFGEGHI